MDGQAAGQHRLALDTIQTPLSFVPLTTISWDWFVGIATIILPEIAFVAVFQRIPSISTDGTVFARTRSGNLCTAFQG
ncbi:MAG: hypothetical protein AB2708_12835, partial [Candidatus Thiodiazotropha taylori]